MDDFWDHGTLLNPHDTKLIDVLREIHTKLWIMCLSGVGEYCNPTAENLSKELFLAQQALFSSIEGLTLYQVRLYETPNCWVDCFEESITPEEKEIFLSVHGEDLKKYLEAKGEFEYDDRKVYTYNPNN